MLVRIETAAGAVGWGEATALADWGGDFGRYYGETPATVIHVVEGLIAPAISGLDVWDGRELATRITGAIRGHQYARAAVDIALWDLRGQLAGQPIHRLLGGAVRERIPVAHMIGLMPPGEAAEEAASAAAEGITAFQVKLTGEPDADVAVLTAVRDSVGAGCALRGDVNQGYGGRPVKHAIDAVRRIQAAGADLVEQPVEGLEDLAAVRAAVDIPVVADESCWTSADARDVVRTRAADAISVYVAKAGGLREALRVTEVAAAHGIPCDVNGSLESGIGTLASVQLAAAAAAVTLPAVISCPAPRDIEQPRYAGRYYADDVLSAAVRFEDGDLIVPSGPGLGVTVDEEKVKLLTIDRGTERCVY